ncbi:ribosomal RNA large subunit methyltransferase H [Candidatus Peregrinibacteria bacterium CG10_big_fil_rev_8_21_14_0_10_54_7]|nr:MAG: ribosomal RNA large subunit methyltransferase H [Candidatus Peregrinibacteria bacterium CG10_big_fil_rev_8_21_14_0_10_54_7]
MFKVTLLCVGPLKSSWAAEGCNQYMDRVRGDLALEVLELPASREKGPARQLQEESSRILEAVEKRSGVLWVLDERGKGMTSEEFSSVLQRHRDAGDAIIFILGGAFGLSDAVRRRAGKILRLSEMTLPHELCRVFFLEQLYRAVQIRKKSGYHH